YELDAKAICHNLGAALSRRPEAYHRAVLRGPTNNGDGAASIHERVVFKQEGLDQRLGYDRWQRNTLIDHFFTVDVDPAEAAAGRAEEQGDFVQGVYDAKLRRNDGRVQVLLGREGSVQGRKVRLTKGVTLNVGDSTLEISYYLENVPADIGLHLCPEFNLA